MLETLSYKTLARDVLGRFGYEIRRKKWRPKGNYRVIHFLHIGKNAGTQVAEIARSINERKNGVHVACHDHSVCLADIPADDGYFFSIRNPVSRFKSGFYSRKRKGQPRVLSEWTADEERAFDEFEHANDLAEALFADGETGRRAFGAINSIFHTAMDQVDWFCPFGNMLETRPPVDIIRKERFRLDMDRFQRRLGIAEPIAPTEDPVRAHRNDYSTVPELSDKAIRNLHAWYAQDFEFYKQCEKWIDESAS